MNRLLAVALFLTLIFGSSCSVKEKGPGGAGGGPRAIVDSDFDFIPDALDLRPKVADIPEVFTSILKKAKTSYRVVVDQLGAEAEIALEKLNLKPKNSRVRKIILEAMREDIAQNPVDLSAINNEESWRSIIFSPWDEDEYLDIKKEIITNKEKELVPYSGVFQLKYKLNLVGLKYVDYIEAIKARGDFATVDGLYSEVFSHIIRNDLTSNLRINTKGLEELETVDFYQTHSFEGDPKLIRENLGARADIAFQLENFNFSRFGKKLNYLDFVQGLQAKLATIIVSTPEGTNRHFVVPDRSILAGLNELGYNIEFNDAGEVTRVGDMSTTVSMPDDIRNPTIDFLDGHLVKFFGASSVNNQMVAGQMYVVGVAFGLGIFSAKKEEVAFANDFEFQELAQVKNLREGDIVEFELKARRNIRGINTVLRPTQVEESHRVCEGERRSVCRTVTLLGWCKVYTSSIGGYKFHSEIVLKDQLKNYFVRLGNEKFSLDKFSKYRSYSGGKNIIGTIHITREILDKGRTLSIFEEIEKKRSFAHGYEGHVGCKTTRFRPPSDGQRTTSQTLDQIISTISLKRIGAKR